MKLSLMLEADSINVQALNMGRIVVDVDGVNLTELINNVAENDYSLRVAEESDQQSLHTTAICNPCRHTLQYRTYHGNGQRLVVLTVTPDQ